MANQWGRDGTSGGQGGGAAGIIIVGVLALAVGLAGGYGATRFLLPATQPQAAPRPQPPSANPDGPLYKLYQDALRQREEALKEAAKLSADLVQVRSRAASVEAELKSLKAQAAGATAADDGAEETLHRQIDALTADSMARQAELDALKATNTRLSKQKEQALRDAGDLKLKLADMSSRLNELDASNENLALHNQQKVKELESATRALKTAEAERQRLATALSAAEQQIAELKSLTVPEAPVVEDAPSTPEPEPDAAPADALTPRSQEIVSDALARAPGLRDISFDERRKLAEGLEKGVCVTDALEDLFVRVPVLTLRSLIRDLKSPC